MIDTTKPNGSENILWDLSDLYATLDETGLEGDLARIGDRTKAFREKWHGRFATASISEFMEMVREYEQLTEDFGRMGAFAHLQWSTDSENVEYGKLMQRVTETLSKASNDIIFVDTELAALPAERIQELMSAPEMASRKHWLEVVMDYKPHTLSEDVEQALNAKSVSSRFAWVRLYDEVSNALTFQFRGQEYTIAQMTKMLYDGDRQTRKEAAETISAGLKKDAKTHAYVFNTIIGDCEVNDRLRSYPTWVSSRNLSNEVSDASVQALVDAVVSRYDLVHRYFALKKRLLGLDELYDYDRYAPVTEESDFWTWEQARQIVIDSYTSFDRRAGEIASLFFDKNWIHAPVRKGKRSGAYSAGTIASVHPYVFMNYTGTSRDVQTLAHELGHGVHQYLSRQQGPLQMHTPLTVAETASVFGEMITFKKMLEATTSDQSKLALIMSKIDGMFGTVFRQVALNRFEEAMHTARRTQGELSLEQINEIWLTTQKAQFGDSVKLSDGYEVWWSYISHFIHTPGYVYAYAFGELLVLALYQIYLKSPDSFPDKYIELLSAGGSKRPEELLAPFGLDITNPTFWHNGLSFIDSFLGQAEELAGKK
ncbi:MAG: hypothetical protein RIR53_972 [Bacteroidota bacterium]|jgi:oligoendopeptidase F